MDLGETEQPKARVVIVVQPPQVSPAEPATAEPATAEPATAEPATAEPATAEPTTAEPATAEPATAEAAPDWIPAEPWTPPVTFSDRFSTWSTRAIRALVVLGLVVFLGIVALWAIPTWRASARPGFQAVRARALADQNLNWLVWEPRRVDRFPRWFSIGPDGERYELVVRGPTGQKAVVRAIVKDGKIVRFLTGPEFDWREGWRGRAFRGK